MGASVQLRTDILRLITQVTSYCFIYLIFPCWNSNKYKNIFHPFRYLVLVIRKVPILFIFEIILAYRFIHLSTICVRITIWIYELCWSVGIFYSFVGIDLSPYLKKMTAFQWPHTSMRITQNRSIIVKRIPLLYNYSIKTTSPFASTMMNIV